MHDELAIWITLAVSIISALYVVGEKLFGGGNKLAAKFGSLELKHTQDIAAIKEKHAQDMAEIHNKHAEQLAQIRNEFYQRTETSDSNTRMGIQTITNNIHILEKGVLEFRAKMAEEYMRRESFYKAAGEITANFKELNSATRTEMHDSFARVEKTLDELAQSFEAVRRSQQPNHKPQR